MIKYQYHKNIEDGYIEIICKNRNDNCTLQRYINGKRWTLYTDYEEMTFNTFKRALTAVKEYLE